MPKKRITTMIHTTLNTNSCLIIVLIILIIGPNKLVKLNDSKTFMQMSADHIPAK